MSTGTRRILVSVLVIVVLALAAAVWIGPRSRSYGICRWSESGARGLSGCQSHRCSGVARAIEQCERGAYLARRRTAWSATPG